MVDVQTARQMALSLPGTEEKDHFGIPSFRVNNKIFATVLPEHARMMVKLPLIEQSIFNSFDSSVFYPVPNKWGLKGATFVELSLVRREMFEDALSIAYHAAKTKKKRKERDVR